MVLQIIDYTKICLMYKVQLISKNNTKIIEGIDTMRKILIVLLSTILLFMLTGCNSVPKEDPQEVMERYYQYIKDSNYEAAYEMSSKNSKEDVSKDDFIKFAGLLKEVFVTQEFKVELVKEYENKKIENIEFKNVVEFSVTEKRIILFENNKEESSTRTRYLVAEDGVWKFYKGKENGKQNVADALNTVANMYTEGKGKTLDLNKAATLLSEALTYDDTLARTYYNLGRVYIKLERYDEGIEKLNKYLALETDTKGLSNGYNVIGAAYLHQLDIDNAKINFEKALELNANNEYAKTNLSKIK